MKRKSTQLFLKEIQWYKDLKTGCVQTILNGQKDVGLQMLQISNGIGNRTIGFHFCQKTFKIRTKTSGF